jgi:hypothetical protein
VNVISPAKRSSRARIESIRERQRRLLLATRTDRLSGRPLQHRPGVRPHRVEVDEGERRLDLGEDRLVALM